MVMRRMRNTFVNNLVLNLLTFDIIFNVVAFVIPRHHHRWLSLIPLKTASIGSVELLTILGKLSLPQEEFLCMRGQQLEDTAILAIPVQGVDHCCVV